MITRRAIFAAAGFAAASLASAQDSAPQPHPTFAEDGTVSVPAFELPPSVFSSDEAQAAQAMRGRIPVGAMTQDADPDIVRRRAALDRMMAPRVKLMRDMYPVDVAEGTLGGVRVRTFTPAGGAFDKERVLINLHGGAFTVCWDSCSMVESIPVASVGKYKVVSVDYRMAPEAKHPAGLMDAVAVYRELLKSYPAERIGVFGCSAGGALTSQMAAWLGRQDALPQVAAAGIFGAGGARFLKGDSAYIAGYVDGSFPPPAAKAPDMTRGYFDGTDLDDPVVSPALHPATAARFPPSLIITGTRAMDMSPAIVTNSALLREGVDSTLIVGEAMGHCYLYNPDLPESRDAYAAIARFFAEHLK